MERSHQNHQQSQNHYVHLGLMAFLSFLATYLLMYSMVDTFASAYMNVNQVYMAALMTAPMVVIELVVMRMMYQGCAPHSDPSRRGGHPRYRDVHAHPPTDRQSATRSSCAR